MRSRSVDNLLDVVAAALILVLANTRAIRLLPLFPTTDSLGGAAWREIPFWLLATGLVVWLLIRRAFLKTYIQTWKKNWTLVLFIGIAFISISWSISPSATLYRALELFFATILGAYLGIRYGSRGLLGILFWFGAAVVFLSFAFALLFPGFGRMEDVFYQGAWNGIFWHRNHLGSIGALLNAVFLIRILLGLRERDKRTVLDAIFYLLSLLLVYLSRSATGDILVIVLNVLIVLAWGWLKIRDRLHARHYYLILGAFVIAGLLIYLKFDFMMSLFNRSSSLTGRVPMWKYLFRNVIDLRPWLGSGFGAIWTLESFRLQVQAVVGWPYPVLIGDNGFIDILLHVGIIGLVLFLINFICMFITSFKLAFHRHGLEYFFPLVILIYALFANISFSLFLELESFVWLLMVAGWFAAQVELEPSDSPVENTLPTESVDC